MIVNMIGYSIGINGLSEAFAVLTDANNTLQNLWLFCGIMYFMVVGVCLMRFLEDIRLSTRN